MLKSLRRSLGALAVLLAVALAMTGCGGGVLSGGSQPSSGGAGKTLKIGVSYPTSNSPFWQAYIAFIQDGAKQLGIQVNAVSADGNEQKQLSDVQNLISQGVDGLIVTPQSTAIAPALLRQAKQANVKVVVTDRYPGYDPGAKPDSDYVGFLGPNDVQAGKDIAETLVGDGATKLLALGGIPGSSVAEGRKQGFEQGVSDKGATTVQYQSAGGESEENGLQTMENLLQAHPTGTANGVWCYNDNLCLGAIKAAQNAGRAKEFKFAGMDLTPDAIKAVENGDYTATFGGHWLQGGFGLVMLYDAINGKAPKQPIVKLNLIKVDASNVAKFKDQYINNPPKYDFKQLSQVTNPSATGYFEITLK